MSLIHETLQAMQDAFRQSRNMVLDGMDGVHTIKSDNSPVTETDGAVENFIVDYMKQRFPDLVVMGEEGGYDENSLPNSCWLIDPIDGTKSYIKQIPGFTGMAVFIENGEAKASIIYNPQTDDMYIAILGNGAYKNGRRINLAETTLPSTVYCKDKILDQLSEILEPLGISTEEAPSGAGFGFAQVVDGISGGRFHLYSGPSIHDHAPGALLVREAGGDIIPVLDNEYVLHTRSFVACHPELTQIVIRNLDKIRNIEDPSQKLS